MTAFSNVKGWSTTVVQVMQRLVQYSERLCLQGLWEHNRMHGDGIYTDAQGHQWSGQFFNGSGPGLTCLL